MNGRDRETGVTKPALIADELRRLIASGHLQRGSRLPQDELARRFDSSITPVREALRALESEGLVESVPHRGTRVAGIDLDRIRATYIVRRLTEGYAMRRAATRLSLRDLDCVAALSAQVDARVASGDEFGARQANRDFHFYFFDRTGIPALSSHIGALWGSFPWDLVLGSPERIAESSNEHAGIISAVRAGDPDAAAAAAEEHIKNGFRALARSVTGAEISDPFGTDVD